MKKYYKEINLLKGLAILLVLLGHSVIYVPINLMEIKWCAIMYKYIYMVHMPLFFVISGFLYHYSGSYCNYINSKIKRILIPYVVFSLVDLIPRHLFPTLINGNNTLIQDIYNIIFSGGQYWFLYTLFSIFLIFPLIEKLIYKGRYYIFIIFIFLIALRILKVTEFLLLNYLVIYLFYFTLGYYIKKIYNENINYTLGKKTTTLVLLIIFFVVGVLPNNTFSSIIKAMLGIVTTYSIILQLKNKNISKFFEKCGTYSLQLYLLNGFILVIARVIVVKVLLITNPFLVIAIIFISNVFIGLVIIEFILNKVYIFKLLCGIKSNNNISLKSVNL